MDCRRDIVPVGIAASAIRFGDKVANPHTRRLLDTFGMRDEAGWLMPLPRLAATGTIGTIDGWMEDMPREEVANTTLVIRHEDKTTVETRFIEDGARIGTMLTTPEGETLFDGEDRELDLRIATPRLSGSPDTARLFWQPPVIRRQLGLVTLKRALSPAA